MLSVDSTKRYNGMMDAFGKIYKYEGVRGLYKVSLLLFKSVSCFELS